MVVEQVAVVGHVRASRPDTSASRVAPVTGEPVRISTPAERAMSASDRCNERRWQQYMSRLTR
ncbi:hypothetical protein [Amycolatopsis sp.]|uniref:hypothetical protein n=1 Tax=Amycolatopsis sp. TaxID=37632 RepID=UPI002E04DE26|nr:hypothetical protein [Amycolatopsis sp.]